MAEEKEVDLWEYLDVVRKRKWLIISAVVIALFIGLIYNYFDVPVYESTTTFIIEKTQTNTVQSPYQTPSQYEAADDIREIIKSRSLIRKAILDLNLDKVPISKNKLSFFGGEGDTLSEILKYYYSQISVSAITGSNVMKVTVQSQRPEDAAAIANKLVDAFSEYVNIATDELVGRSSSQIDEQIKILQDKIDKDRQLLKQKKLAVDYKKRIDLEKSIESYRRLYDQLLNKQENLFLLTLDANQTSRNELDNMSNYIDKRLIEIDSIIKQKETELDALATSQQISEIDGLETAIETNQKLLQTIMEKKEIGDLAIFTSSKQIRVLDPAYPPIYPIATKGIKAVMMFVFFGMIIGFGISYGLEFFDRSFKDADDVESTLGLQVLATIPDINLTLNQPGNKNPKSTAVEAFRNLRANIKFVDKNVKTMLITSPAPKTGKTLILSNLGLMMNSSDDKVLLIDGDLRKSNLHHMFKIDKEPGLSDVLTGTSQAKEAIKKVKDNLYVLPAGTKVKNPQKLLESEKMTQLLETFKKEYDYVLIDSVPSLLLTDAEILASKVDATILVINAKITKKDEAIATKKNFEKIKTGRLLGAIFNCASGHKDRYYYYYHYNKYY